MRMSTEADRDDQLAGETIAAALEAGITVFDTAHAYGRDESELGHNERLLAGVLSSAGAGARAGAGPGARIVTKGGMTRPGGAWVPDGRAKAILRDCEASVTALGGLPIDLYLIHAPDARTPWRTTVRALARLLDEGLVAHVGVSNVNRHQLDEALALAPIAAVQVALSVHDDRALRGGVVARCEELGIALIAHSPLGGPGRAGRLGRRPDLAAAAEATSATPAEVALAWLLGVSPAVVAIPGARRPDTARSEARATRLSLPGGAIGAVSAGRTASPPVSSVDGEVVLIMGIPGAGKTRVAGEYAARGYVRLNRDERGGALRELAEELERRLGEGETRVVLDNTYLTRSARSYVVDAARRQSVPARCVWVETPLAQAQVNLVQRLLERFGALPTPEELRELARGEPGLLAPTRQMRALRELEPPAADEGFASVEPVPFKRSTVAGKTRAGVFVAAAALDRAGWQQAIAKVEPSAPALVFDWRPDGTPEDLEPAAALLRDAISGPVEAGLCPHGGGAPICWCRPPLPGLALAFAHAHGLDPARSILIGTSAAHRTLAATLGAGYVAADGGVWR